MFANDERMQELKRQEIKRRKKRNIKLGGIVLACICAIVLFCNALLPPIKKTIFIAKYGQEIYDMVGLVEEGKTIKFGRYEQDNNFENGKDEIEWYVYKVEGDRALVISKYALDCKPYHKSNNLRNSDLITWANCSLREWLNNDFYDIAFTEKEKAMIPQVTHSKKTEPKFSDSIFLEYTTEDYIFLWSLEDERLIPILESEKPRQCAATPFARMKGVQIDDSGYTQWWLRDVQYEYHTSLDPLASCITSSGIEWRCKVEQNQIAVRPALWIDLKP